MLACFNTSVKLGLVRAAALLFLIAAATRGALASTKLLETGSTLLYPLMTVWVKSYTQQHGDVQISTESTGSGRGITDAISGAANIGASDAYLSDNDLTQAENVPLAIGAQTIDYNLPGLNDGHLQLSGPVLAGIYGGTIRYWDDAAIVALNARLPAKLPHAEIVTIVRSDSSGDTFLFTQYLSFTTPGWAKGPGFGTKIAWPPTPKAMQAVKNAGMVQMVKDVPYSIGYAGISFLDRSKVLGLGVAALQNRDGNFVLPTPETLGATAQALAPKTPQDGRLSLIFAPGAHSYPLVNYEYAVVRRQQPNKDIAAALAAFLGWTIAADGGNAQEFLGPLHFIALPERVRAQSRKLIAQIR